jgi:hypothetical protein
MRGLPGEGGTDRRWRPAWGVPHVIPGLRLSYLDIAVSLVALRC